MALPDLASDADLTARGVTPTTVHETMLAVASSLVRAAAGSPILETTSTVALAALDATRWLDLPGQPVTEVSAVAVDGVTLDSDSYKLAGGRLWGVTPWSDGCEPAEVVVTLTHGLAEVPAHIVQLVCDLAILGASAAADGATDPRVAAEQIDDYKVQFFNDSVASAMEIPALTRRWLRAQFGGGVATLVVYR